MSEQNRVPDAHPRWADAAAAAKFTFYELVEPLADHTWAGGYGFGGIDGTVSLGILHNVDGVEVSVQTRRAGRAEDPRHLHGLLSDLVMHALYTNDRGVVLPSTWHFTASDRMVTVDGIAIEFAGVELAIAEQDIGAWAGTGIDTYGSAIDLRVDALWTQPFAVATCQKMTLSDIPPEAAGA